MDYETSTLVPYVQFLKRSPIRLTSRYLSAGVKPPSIHNYDRSTSWAISSCSSGLFAASPPCPSPDCPASHVVRNGTLKTRAFAKTVRTRDTSFGLALFEHNWLRARPALSQPSSSTVPTAACNVIDPLPPCFPRCVVREQHRLSPFRPRKHVLRRWVNCNDYRCRSHYCWQLAE